MASHNGPGRAARIAEADSLSGRILIPFDRETRTLAFSSGGSGGPPDGIQLTPQSLWASFRRQWFLALALGLVLGGMAAAAAWYLVPAPYEAFAELRVSEVPDRILFETERPPAFSTYKQTQMRLVTSPFVLAAALRDPEVSSLSILQEQEHEIEWLEEELEVASPATEFVRISLSGDRPKELATIVNAVQNVYLQEVVEAQKRRRRERKQSLEDIFREIEEKLRKRRTYMRELAEKLHTSDSKTLTVKQQMAVEYFGQLRKEHAQIRFDLMRARTQLAARQALPEEMSTETNADPQPTSPNQPATGGGPPQTAAPMPRAQDAGASPPAGSGAGVTGAADANSTPEAAEDVDGESLPGLDDLTIEAELAEMPEIQALKDEVRRFERLLDRTAERVRSKDHPALREIEADLARAQSDLALKRKELEPLVRKRYEERLEAENRAGLRQIERQIAILEKQEEQLRGELESQQMEAKQMGIDSFELESLKQEIDQIDKVANRISEEIQRLDVELNSDPRVSVHRVANVPHEPQLATRQKVTALAGLGVLGLVVSSVMFMDLRSRRISYLHEVVDGLDLRVLGTLPVMPRGVTEGKARLLKARHTVLKNIWKESVDSMRTMLLRDASADQVKVIMVASATGGEGKSTLACHLATSLAQSGRKTLLIDTDLRRPSLHAVFNLPPGPGFSEVLRGEVGADEAVQPTSGESLFLMPAGQIDAASLQRLANDAAGPVFARLKSGFDFIVVDSAPVLPVTDSLMIGQHVDAALFAIRRDISVYGKVAAACQRLSMLEIPLLGAVVIGLEESSYGKRYPSYAAAVPRIGSGAA